MFPARPEHGSAVLLLEPWARWVAEYYPVEQVVELPPERPRAGRGGTGHDHGHRRYGGEGRARVLLRYADPAWLVRLVLGLGGGARILEPAELAAEVARRAAQALAQADGAAEDRTAGTERERSGMTGVVGALVALAVVVALVLVLACPPARAAAGPQRGGAARGHRGPARPAAGDCAPRLHVDARPAGPPFAAVADLPHWGPRTPPPVEARP